MNDEKEMNDFEFESEDEVQNPQDTIKKLRKKLKEAEEKVSENMDGWQRARADYSNLQKESGLKIDQLKGYIVGSVVEDLLPVLDSFGMAMGNTEVWEKVDANWRIGIEYILKQFNDMLGKYNVQEIKTEIDHNFDPELHLALESVETEDASQSGKIARVMQKGYKMGSSVIRPVNVKTFEFKN